LLWKTASGGWNSPKLAANPQDPKKLLTLLLEINEFLDAK